jgi:hypothetical protein
MERTQLSQIESKPVQSPSVISHSTPVKPVVLNDVPVEVLRQFGIDHRVLDTRMKDMLNDIYVWTASELGDITPGNITRSISDVQLKLGGDRSYERVWNWLRAKQSIIDLEKQQRAMEFGNA